MIGYISIGRFVIPFTYYGFKFCKPCIIIMATYKSYMIYKYPDCKIFTHNRRNKKLTVITIYIYM
jgi:hypothetical protein